MGHRAPETIGFNRFNTEPGCCLASKKLETDDAHFLHYIMLHAPAQLNEKRTKCSTSAFKDERGCFKMVVRLLVEITVIRNMAHSRFNLRPD